jgi:hypothetical protein
MCCIDFTINQKRSNIKMGNQDGKSTTCLHGNALMYKGCDTYLDQEPQVDILTLGLLSVHLTVLVVSDVNSL